MDETFFVKISDPNKLRVSLLSSSKASLESLKFQLKLQELHKQKVDAKKELDEQFSELVTSLHELATLLPHQEILEQVKKSHPSKSKKKTSKKASAKKMLPKKTSDLDKLNEALEEIEKRLNKLQ